MEIKEADVKFLQQFNATGVEMEAQQQRYPAIQLNDYEGLKPNSPLWFCFSETSVGLMPDEFKAALNLEVVECYYKGQPCTMFKPSATLRFVPLSLPKVFKFNKNTGEISNLSKFAIGDRSIAKLFMAVIAEGKLVSNDEQTLVVTLKLSSFRTDEVIGRDPSQDGTLKKLSAQLTKHGLGGGGRSNLHFINLQITPLVKLYKGKGESSYGATYALDGAKLNTAEDMVVISKIFEDENLIQSILDPFGLSQKPNVDPQTGEITSAAVGMFGDGLPF